MKFHDGAPEHLTVDRNLPDTRLHDFAHSEAIGVGLIIQNSPENTSRLGVPTGLLQIIGTGYRDEVVYRVSCALGQTGESFLNPHNMPTLWSPNQAS